MKETNMNDQVACMICGQKRKQITVAHARSHGFKNTKEYQEKFPDARLYTQETLKKRRKSRRLKLTETIDDRQIDHNFHEPKNRTNRRISYDEFLKLVHAGNSINDIRDTGVSKHQLAFYSALSQNKIKITRGQFEVEYLAGKSLDEIAKRYDINRGYVTHLREYFGIKRLGPKFINRKKTEKPLSDFQKRMAYGSLMGDSFRMSPSSLKMKHSIKQRYHLLWKYDNMIEHISPHSFSLSSAVDKRNGNSNYAFHFYTNANTDIENIISEFYPDGAKVISDSIMENLNELSLACWFMDDGTTRWYEEQGWNATCEFCTDDFPHESILVIMRSMKEKWGLTASIRKNGAKKDGTAKYRIRLKVDDTQSFFDMVRPHVIPSMLYKIDREAARVRRIENAKREDRKRTDPIGLLREEVNEIAQYLIDNHKNRLDELDVIRDIEVSRHVVAEDVAYRLLKF